MVNARQVHKYPEEEGRRVREKARSHAELGTMLVKPEDPFVVPLRRAAAESFVSPRPSPSDECGSKTRSCTSVTDIDTVQKDKRLKQTVVQLQTVLEAAKNREAQLRKTAADADAGVEGLLCKMELMVDQAESLKSRCAPP